MGRSALSSGKAITRLSEQLGRARTINRAVKIEQRIQGHAGKIGQSLTMQGVFQGDKYLVQQLTDAGGANGCKCRK